MPAQVNNKEMAEPTLLLLLVQALHQTHYDNLIRSDEKFYSDKVFFSVQIATLRLRCSVNYNLAYVNSAESGFTGYKTGSLQNR